MLSKLVVVGKRFNAFLENKQVLEPNSNYLKGEMLSVGQGLSNKEYNKLKKQNVINTNVQKEHKKNVHKRYQKNVMISAPQKLNDTRYTAELLLDDDCAEMSDHITGQHLQGMVIIEAARQMMLSVTERYLIPEDERYTKWIILQSVNSNFISFLFPISVHITYEIKEKSVRSSRDYFNSKVSFYQNDKVQTEVEISYSVHSRDDLVKKERRLAQRALQNYLNKDMAP